MHLVLGSTSRYRRELLERLHIPFEVAGPHIDETPLPDESPVDTAKRLSVAKARAVAEKFPGALVIGSDQVAVLEGRQVGKPGDHDNAVAQLRAARGKIMVFHTALCLYNGRTGQHQLEDVTVEVKYRDLSDTQIETYLRKEQPYDCAGSAKSEGMGIALLEYLRCDDPSALVGLPLIALTRMLLNEGVDVLAQPGV
jgi:septum formation protein